MTNDNKLNDNLSIKQYVSIFQEATKRGIKLIDHEPEIILIILMIVFISTQLLN